MGSAAGGRRPLESADPLGPACGSMEREGKRGYLNQKLTTGGRGPLHYLVKPCPVGVAFGVRKLGSRAGESQFLHFGRFLKVCDAPAGSRRLFWWSLEVSGEVFWPPRDPSGELFLASAGLGW